MIERLIDMEIEECGEVESRWRALVSDIDLGEPESLAAVISAYLDEMALRRTESSVATSELLIETSIAPASFPNMSTLVEREVGFWQDILAKSWGALSPLFGRAIAGYIRDELPFAVACAGDGGYRLLRMATIQRLSQGFAVGPSAFARQFDALVLAAGDETASSLLSQNLTTDSRKAELTRQIASLIAEQGLAAVTHRAVAQRADVPHSTIAHHFRTHEELLYGGIAGMALAMRGEFVFSGGENREPHYGMAMIRATHSAALAAARDPALISFALDMRRRRGENVRTSLAEKVGLDPQSDGAGLQAGVMALIGCGLIALTGRGTLSVSEFNAAELTSLKLGTERG